MPPGNAIAVQKCEKLLVAVLKPVFLQCFDLANEASSYLVRSTMLVAGKAMHILVAAC